MTAGLSRVQDNSPPKTVFNLMICYGMENMTKALMRGDPFTAHALQEMETLRARFRAFSNALDNRLEEEERRKNK